MCICILSISVCFILCLCPSFAFPCGQIEFLNSVIVDLQCKNQELKSQMEKMAEAALNGNNANELDNYDRFVPIHSCNSLLRPFLFST